MIDTAISGPHEAPHLPDLRGARRSGRNPVRHIFLGIGGRGSLMLVNMLVLMVTSRLLTPNDFGLFAVGQLCIDFAATVSYALVGVPMLQRTRMQSAYYANAFTLLLVLGCLSGALLGLVAGLVDQWLDMPGLAPMLRAIALIIPLRFLASFFIAALQRHLQVEKIISAQTRAQVTSAISVTMVCALLGFGTWSLILGLAASTALELYWCVRATRPQPHLALNGESRAIAIAGVAPLANRLLIFASDSLDRLAIGAVFGASQLGIYSRAANLVLLPSNLIGLPAQNALLSWFSRIKGQTMRVSSALANAVSVQSFLLFPITVAFCLAAPLMVRILLGEQWATAIPVAQILFVGGFARLGAIPLEAAALTLGYAWGSARRQLAAAGVLVVGLVLAVPHSLVWAAVAVAASRLVYYVLGLRFAVITFNLSWGPILADHAKGMLVSLIAVIAALVADGWLRPASPLLAELLAVTAYGLAAGLILIAGPERLVGPAGARTLAVTRNIVQQALARIA